jgi:uncharacterized protein
MLYPSERKFRMSDTMLERYIRSHIATSLEAGQTEVLFAWQGGEPTMLGLDYFRKILDLQAKYRPDAVRIANTIQTNGTLLNGEWAAFLAAENFLVGISVDGPKKQHDHYRMERSDRPTFCRGFRSRRVEGIFHPAFVSERLSAVPSRRAS